MRPTLRQALKKKLWCSTAKTTRRHHLSQGPQKSLWERKRNFYCPRTSNAQKQLYLKQASTKRYRSCLNSPSRLSRQSRGSWRKGCRTIKSTPRWWSRDSWLPLITPINPIIGRRERKEVRAQPNEIRNWSRSTRLRWFKRKYSLKT